MPKKPPSPTAIRNKELEDERSDRLGLLFASLRVVHREDKTIVIEPAAGHRLTLVYQVDAEGRRMTRILVGPAPAGKPRG